VSGLTSPFVGRWIDRRGPREAILLGAVATAASYVLMATTQNLWQWYLYSTINAVFRQLMFFLPFQALVSRFFDQRRGIALGILGTGFSLGGFVVVPVMAQVIDMAGWDGSFVFSAVAIVVVFVPLGLFLVKNTPADVGQLVDGLPQTEESIASGGTLRGVPLSEAIRTPLFWTLAAAVTLFFFGMFAWLIHQVPFWESVGLSRGSASLLVSLSALLGIATRLSFGFLVDRLRSMELAALGLAAMLMAGMIVLSISTSPVAIGIFLCFWVVGAGGGPMMEAILLTRAFGVAHFATIFGVFIVVETMGQMASPVLAGWIFDATGSYDLVLLMWAGTFAGSIALFAIASRLPRPQLRRPAAAEVP
jgi:sugar phosphate permease